MALVIENVAPELVGAIDTLPVKLREEAISRRLSETEADALMAALPQELAACGCFLDRLTGLWRYEFGAPHTVGRELVYGTHMWPLLRVLFEVLQCARSRLPPEKLRTYLVSLSDPVRHFAHIPEMFPVLRLAPEVAVEHEMSGFGTGNTTVDWVIGPVGPRRVIIDVKRRLADFLAQMGTTSAAFVAPPEHDVALLFRSVETKLRAADPAEQLQGAWVVTDIKQERAELQRTFDNLDPSKVHFAILGDEQPDVFPLTRRAEDREFLLDLLGLTESERFVFSR
jgi:hypothetical protein